MESKEEFTKTIIENMEKLRKEHGYTQLDVANFLQISQAKYSTLKSGQREISGYELCRLGNLYGVTVCTLMLRKDKN